MHFLLVLELFGTGCVAVLLCYLAMQCCVRVIEQHCVCVLCCEGPVLVYSVSVRLLDCVGPGPHSLLPLVCVGYCWSSYYYYYHYYYIILYSEE